MAPGSSQPGCAVQGPSGSGTFHHQRPTSALALPASMAWTCSQGSLPGLPCSWFHAEAKTPQPWGLGKLGMGMVLKGGPTHSGSRSLSQPGPLCVPRRVQSPGTLFPNSGPGCLVSGVIQGNQTGSWGVVGAGTGGGVGHTQVGTWTEGCLPRTGQQGATVTHVPPRKAPGPWLWAQVLFAPGAPCSARGHVPRTKARSGWGRLCNPALSWASSLGR